MTSLNVHCILSYLVLPHFAYGILTAAIVGSTTVRIYGSFTKNINTKALDHVHSLLRAWLIAREYILSHFSTLRPRGNGCHFPNEILKCILLNANIWIAIEISLNYFTKVPITNMQALFRIMVWRRPGDKPLSEPMIVSLPTHLYVTLPQWVNIAVLGCCLWFDDMLCEIYKYRRWEISCL